MRRNAPKSVGKRRCRRLGNALADIENTPNSGPEQQDGVLTHGQFIQDGAEPEPSGFTKIELTNYFPKFPGTLQIVETNPYDALQFLKDHWQVIAPIATVVGVAIGATINILRHRREEASAQRERERTESAERLARAVADKQQFNEILTSLNSTEVDAKAAAATRLLPFLREAGKESFHQQVFQIAVNHLRNRVVDPKNPQLNIADKAFLPVFLEAATKIRESLQKVGAEITEEQSQEYLNASGIHLDGVNLREPDLNAFSHGHVLEIRLGKDFPKDPDLSYVRMKYATFTSANMLYAYLFGANLDHSHFSGARAPGSTLTRASLIRADLSGADFESSVFENTQLQDANFTGAGLTNADLTDANLTGADFTDAGLDEADLSKASLFNSNLEDAFSLRDTNLYGTYGLDREQLQRCLEKGAIQKAPDPEPPITN